MQEWIISALSEEQQAPLKSATTGRSILAAAGSGKTRTLAYALAAELARGTVPESITAFTFTEKAAAELLTRIHGIVRRNIPDTDVTGLFVGTIHSWCFQFLSEQSEFYNFTPLDELHADSLVSRLYDDLDLQKAYGKTFPYAIGDFLADLEVYYNEHLTLQDVPQNIRPCIELFLRILHENRLITFGGMIRHAIEHLNRTGPLPHLRALYVDEYQDVNPAQVALIKAMLPPEGRIVVVGDDLQCIYNWRGSDVRRILDFPHEFTNTSTHRLSDNYRSRPPVVTSANAFAETISLRDPDKVMRPKREETPFDVVHWIKAATDDEQASTVADIIERFHSSGVPYRKMAVLLRSVLGWGSLFEAELSRRDIPIISPVLGRSAGVIDGFLIPVFDWIRKDPSEPKNELEEQLLIEAGNDLWTSVSPWVTAENGEDVFWNEINTWIDAVEESGSGAYNVRSHLYDFLDVLGITLRPEDNSLGMGIGIASQIIRSVEEIHRRRLRGRSRVSARRLISEIYHALIRYKQQFGDTAPITATSDGVVITTVHQAKGLEWPVVILPMVMSRRFPLRSRPHGTSFPDSIAERYGTSLDDERRLFYVAMTRARERLFILDSTRHVDRSVSIFRKDLERRGVINAIDSDLERLDQRVWHLDPTDLEESDPPPIRIGLSDLLIYTECPFQYGLRRVVAAQPAVGDELGFGKSLHELIQRRTEAPEPWTTEELEAQVDKHVFMPLTSQDGEDQSKQVIRERIAQLEKLGVFSGSSESEIDVEVLIGDHIVHGIIDGVNRIDDGSVTIRDWKSNVHDTFMPRYERQLQFYAYALAQKGFHVVEADVVDVGATSKQRRLVRCEIPLKQEAIDALLHLFSNSLCNIVAGEFPATPSPGVCSTCDMRRICSMRSIDAPA